MKMNIGVDEAGRKAAAEAAAEALARYWRTPMSST